MRLIDADEVLKRWGLKFYAMGGDRLGPNGDEISFYVNGLLNEIQNAPTVDITEQITIKCVTEEEKQKLLSALRNAKLKVLVKERPQGEWIPTSDRLPECMDNVLVTIQVGNRNPVVRSGYYAYGLFNIDNGDVWNWNDTEVKAWMPQPMPYEEVENES